jgi:ribosomal protein S18 acetylase RimI-like enzyme
LCGSHSDADANIGQAEWVIVERLEHRHLDDAAALLVESSDSHALPSQVSDVAQARDIIERGVGTGPAVVARDGAAVVGFMVAPLPTVPGGGASRIRLVEHAARPTVARDAYRRMYESIADDLVAAGCFDHTILVATDQQATVASFFELQFGIDQIKGARALSGAIAAAPGEDTIRAAELADLDRLIELSIELSQFHARSPMLAPALLDVARMRRSLTEHIGSERETVLVAAENETIVGMIQAQPDGFYANTATIYMNIVAEHARSAGVGTTMLTALFAWAANLGFEHCAVGWDSANLLSDAFYRARGFTPVRYELRRLIDPRVAWANGELDYRFFRKF